MALPAVVQHQGGVINGTSGTTLSVTLTFGSDFAAGNLLLVYVGIGTGGGTATSLAASTPADGAGNWDYGSIHEDFANFATTNAFIVTAGGTNSITAQITFSAALTTTAGACILVDGFEISSVSALDLAVTTTPGTTSTSWSSGSATTNYPNALWVGTCFLSPFATTTETVTGPGTPWTNETVLSSTYKDSSSAFTAYQVSGYRAVSGTGTMAYSGTVSGACYYVSEAVSFYTPPGPATAALPGPAWRRRFQPWRRAGQLRNPPPILAPVTSSGSAALAPMGVSGSGTVTGTPVTVTATQGGTGAQDGIALTVKVVTGAAATQNGATGNSSTLTTPQQSITPDATGSYIYGAVTNEASATSFTADAATTFSQNVLFSGDGDTFGTWRVTSKTTANSAVTAGASAPTGVTSGELFWAAAEILAAAGQTLAEDASSPAVASTTSATTLATAGFVPPPGSLLVATVSANYTGTGTLTMQVSGGGLTWTQLAGETLDLASVWIAQVPAAVAPSAPSAATPGPAWRQQFQPWRRAALARAQPPAVITCTGSAALAPMTVAGSAAVTAVAAPPATPGPSWRLAFQPWRRAAGQRQVPPPVIACTGTAALAPAAVSASGSAVSSAAAPAAALPAQAWQRIFQPWRQAAGQRTQPPPVITASGSAALAPVAVSGADVVAAVASPPAQPGPAWRRAFQPWRRAVGQQSMPPPAITCTGSVILAPMAVAGSGSGSPEMAPAAALPAPSWQRVYQPWRRAAQQRIQPPAVIAATGAPALAPLAVSAAAAAVTSPLSPPAAPGASWRIAFQPWRRAAQQRVQPPAVVTAAGSVALAPMAVAGTAPSAAVPFAAALPGLPWRRQFQPWRRAARSRIQPPAVITANGSPSLAPVAVAGSGSMSSELPPAAAQPGPAWQRRFQPWRKAAGQRQQPPGTIACTGSPALAPLKTAASAAVTTPVSPPALPGPAWKRQFQPWRRAAGQRVQPPQPVTANGAVALAPLAVSAAGTVTQIGQDPSTPPVVIATGTTTETLTTASFSPPAGSLLVVMVALDYLNSTATGPTLAVSDSASGSYTAGPAAYDTKYDKAAIWTRYLPAAPGTITVTVTDTGAASQRGWILDVRVLNGAAARQARAGTASTFDASTTTSFTGTITTTIPQSWVMVTSAVASLETLTPNSATTTLENEQDATEGTSLLTGRQAAPTVTPGATALGWTGGTATEYAWAALEILPAIPAGPVPPIQPGPAWRRVFQPWRRAAGMRVQAPPPVATSSGSAALTPAGVSGSVQVIPLPAPAPAALPAPSWQRIFQPWRRAAAARVQPPAVITATGSAALAPPGTAGTDIVFQGAPLAALPAPSWKQRFQPWRRAACLRVQPPAAVTCTGSPALAPMAVANSTGLVIGKVLWNAPDKISKSGDTMG